MKFQNNDGKKKLKAEKKEYNDKQPTVVFFSNLRSYSR